MSNIIEIENAWKTYSMGEVKVHALRGINLKIKKGEFIAVQGPSGSGKSTSMFMIGCLDIPSRGRVFLDNRDISKLEESQLAQIRGRKIGFVFQQFNLLPILTAIDNVGMPMIFQNVPEIKRKNRAKELLRMVGLGERMEHKPNQMSGGEMQRVAIARALANNPEVLLADEPTGNLDSRTGREVMALLQRLHEKEKRTIVMVTHDKSLGKYAERTIYLKDGQIVN